jgi:hypothetical protein
VADWRRRALANLHNEEGRRVEFEVGAVAHHADWERGDVDAQGNPVLEKPAQEKPRPGRETVEILTRDLAEQMLKWSAQDPGKYMERIRQMKELGGLGHLTDEEAARQVQALCRKVSEMDARRIYEQLDLLGKA